MLPTLDLLVDPNGWLHLWNVTSGLPAVGAVTRPIASNAEALGFRAFFEPSATRVTNLYQSGGEPRE